ncbi:MAG: creatininase family protein [Candidatus Korarchaeota archaeon]|nr:creatininase family protein [Candidatus Korarchaeota archaeon]NIU84544.1 creatininase family protein [Candidatus Thorarchaeota archaeon]NIW14611.1 creatininase family protein [Candidatus Thorarchaeota archaeon]NIW52683.1 creatininase family protein [Candidatus Korarchaeota archaeon]
MWLHEKRWPDVEKYLRKDDRIIIPVGSTEQHGAHAPLGTDSLAAISVAEDVSKEIGVMVAPPLWFGWSPHHLPLPGSISIRSDILVEMLYDIIRSLSVHGFENFVVLNGHRLANIPWIQIAVEKAQRTLDVKVVIFDPGYMSKEIVDELGFGPLGHADETETSHMLHKYPALVDLDKAKDFEAEEETLYHPDPRDPRDTLCYVPSTKEDTKRLVKTTEDAVVGKPSSASAEKGKEYHEYLVERLITVLRKLKKGAKFVHVGGR